MESGYLAINQELSRREAHQESIKGKPTPFRCVFKTQCGWAYTYHETYEDALNGEYTTCGYSVFGSPYTSRGRKSRIEIEGPRGGWKKYTPTNTDGE